MSNIVSISRAKSVIQNLWAAKGQHHRILLQGAPGTAKSSIVAQAAKDIGYKMIDVRLAQKAPEDITGYPYVVDGVMSFARPDWFPTESKTVLFLDEIAQSAIAVQNAALQLVLDRQVGPHKLPDDCIVIAASNRPEDRAGANALTTALYSRFTAIVTIEPEVPEWIEYAKSVSYNALVIAWVQSQYKKILDFDPKRKGGFVCPRTLEYAGDLLDAYNNDPEHPDLSACLVGMIGDSAAGSLLAFVSTMASLPTYKEIISDPLTAKTNNTMVEPIARLLAAHTKFAEAPKVVRYIERYPVDEQGALVKPLVDAGIDHGDIKELAKGLGFKV